MKIYDFFSALSKLRQSTDYGSGAVETSVIPYSSVGKWIIAFMLHSFFYLEVFSLNQHMYLILHLQLKSGATV